MPLAQDEDEKLKQWSIGQFNPFSGGKSLAPAQPIQKLDIPETEVDSKVQDSHPGHTSDDLENYVKNQETQIDKYGPEQEKAVLDNIAKSQGSFGNRLARGGAGFGDALMAIGGKQSPGFLNSLENRENIQEKQALESIPALNELNMKNMGAKQSLESMNRKSPIGSVSSSAYQKIFKQLFPNMSQDQLDALTANPQIAAKIFPEIGPIIEKQIQGEIQKENTDINRQRLISDTENQKKQRELEEKGKQTQAAEATSKNYSPIKSFFGVGPSTEQEQAAQKVLSENAGANLFSPDVVSYAKKHNITPEQANQIKIRRGGK